MIVYLLFLPPPLFLPIDVATAADASPFVRLLRRRPCTPTVELPGKQCPITSPTYRLSVYIYLLH